ncbi:MAG: murein biosynthesis integral membrane protein MurJ [Candidatus Paceibacterota bacterium]|jgi:putative peptidoglycan lipid II flippase|nr:murein biosynthesis integral membrane protein MurJ [Candidatus Paceibacterota bacterium]MDD4830904.1 murein biosynthesis integral membrane protein MurJ [Candidatus Paceibacterota bacterium]MDD4875018.1 murein biosynthesis integral membrane protein MurJ [Candidatus Paceibacterota bacterium]
MILGKVLNSSAKSVNYAAIILAVTVFFSQILGLLRDRLLAGSFGASLDLSIYYAAFRIPDFVYNILFAGSIVVAFLPIFAEHYAEDKEEAWEMSSFVLNSFLLFSFILIALLFIFAPFLIKLIVPGFDNEAQAETAFLARVMLLSPLFFGMSSFFSSILQYFNKFLAYSLAPLLYNLGIILGIVFLSPRLGILGAALGVVFGAAAHLLIQIPVAVKCGFKYRPLFSLKHPAVLKIVNLAFFRSLAASLSQINFMVIAAIASGIGLGAIAIFNLSYNLSFLPIGILGVSLATAVFPSLVQSWTEGKKEEFYESFSLAFRRIIFLALPIGILFFVLREPIVETILRTGQFNMKDASLTSACLGIYSFAILPQCLVPLILRGFFSAKDTKTPAVLAFLFVVFNIVLSMALVSFAGQPNIFSSFLKESFGLNRSAEDLKMLALCFAFLAALIFQFIIFMVFLYRKIGNFKIAEICRAFWKMLFAALASCFFGQYLLEKMSLSAGSGFWAGFWQVAAVGGISFLLYFLITIILGSTEAKGFISSLLNRFNRYGKTKTD